jgi:hypothetical protein
MDIAMIVARILHVGGGVFWGGTLIFMSRFLVPALGDAGPAGGQVMGALAGRGLMRAMPTAAIITVLAGIYLFYRVSAGFDPIYMGSGAGITYSIGGLSAVIALILGATAVRGPMEKALKLGQSLSSTPEAERGGMMNEINALRSKGASATRLVSILIMITVFCMAIGRYV